MASDVLVMVWVVGVVGGCWAEVDIVRAVLVHEEHISPTPRTVARFVDELLSIQLRQAPSRGQVPKNQYSRPAYAPRPNYNAPPPVQQQKPIRERTRLSPATVSQEAPQTRNPHFSFNKPQSSHKQNHNNFNFRGSKSVAKAPTTAEDNAEQPYKTNTDEYKKIVSFFLTAFDQRY